MANRVTLFVESRDQRASEVYIDAAELEVFPCPIEPPDEEEEIPEPETCLDLATVDPGPIVAGGLTTIEGVVFEPLDGSTLLFVTCHEPVGAFKLAVPEQGMRVSFADPVEAAVVTVASADSPVSVIATRGLGLTVDAESAQAPPGQPHQISVAASDITAIVISGGQRVTVSEICFTTTKQSNGLGFFGVLHRANPSRI